MLIGTAAEDYHAAGSPQLESLASDPVALEGVELIKLTCEAENASICELLPPAVHPTVPAMLSWTFYNCPASPWGAFRLALSHIECRSGTRPRAFLVSGVIDNDQARAALTRGWGYRLAMGELDFLRGYDIARVGVRVAGRDVLRFGLRGPVLLPPDVVQFVSSLHPAQTPRGYRLLQVDVAHEFERAERGAPFYEGFDAEAWGEARLRPTHPIAASVCLATIRLRELRFVCRPGEIAFTGTEPVAET
jgi:hypothetical protein